MKNFECRGTVLDVAPDGCQESRYWVVSSLAPFMAAHEVHHRENPLLGDKDGVAFFWA